MSFEQKRNALLVIIALAGLASFIAPTTGQQLAGVGVGLAALALLTLQHIRNGGDQS